jgi:hypothetical protein
MPAHGTNVGSAAYIQNHDYFAAYARWHAELTPADKETVLVVIDAFTHARWDAAAEITSTLPSAPKRSTRE